MVNLKEKQCEFCGQRISDKLRSESGLNERLLIYENDFRDLKGAVLADNSIDAVISDPPYGSGGFTLVRCFEDI